MIYAFSSFQFDTNEGSLRDERGKILLRPKTAMLLSYFMEHPGELLTKEQLLEAIWPDTIVTDNTLMQGVQELRRLLGDNAREPNFIQTLPRRGYQWIAEVRALAASEEKKKPVEPPAPSPRRTLRLLGILAVLILSLLAWHLLVTKPKRSLDTLSWAVLPTENQTGNARHDWMTWGLSALLSEELRQYNQDLVSPVDVFLADRELPGSDVQSLMERLRVERAVKVRVFGTDPFNVTFEVYSRKGLVRKDRLNELALPEDTYAVSQAILNHEDRLRLEIYGKSASMAALQRAFNQGDLETVSKEVQTIPYGHPDYVRARVLLGKVLLSQSSWDFVNFVYPKQMGVEAPQSLDRMKGELVIGMINMQAGRLEQAEESYLKVFTFCEAQDEIALALKAGHLWLEVRGLRGEPQEPLTDRIQALFHLDSDDEARAVQLFYSARDGQNRYGLKHLEQSRALLNYYRNMGSRHNEAMTNMIMAGQDVLPSPQRLQYLENAYATLVEVGDEPNQLTALYLIAQHHRQQGHWDLAKEYVRKLLDLGEDTQNFFHLAPAYKLWGKLAIQSAASPVSTEVFNEARKSFLKAERYYHFMGARPNLDQTRLFLYCINEEKEYARGDLEPLRDRPAMALWPVIAEARQMADRPNEALSLLANQDPKDPVQTYVLSRERAWFLAQTGKQDLAKTALESIMNHGLWSDSDQKLLRSLAEPDSQLPGLEPLTGLLVRIVTQNN